MHTSTFPDLATNLGIQESQRAYQRAILVEQRRFQKRAELPSGAALNAVVLTLFRTGMQAQGPARPREACIAPPGTTC